MSAFDDLTLGEVEEMTKLCLNGKTFTDADPLQLSGAVLYMTRRKTDPALDWGEFKSRITMGEIKAFSIQMEADELDPTHAPMS